MALITKNSIRPELQKIEWRLLKYLSKVSLKIEFATTKKAVFLLNVSGGRDSMGLLQSFLAIKKSYFLRHPINSEKPLQFANSFQVVHFNHQTRPECQTEEDFLRLFCIENGVPLHVFRLEKKSDLNPKLENFQQFARNWRRETTFSLQKKISNLHTHAVSVTAHHSRDVAENIVLKMLRGTSIQTWGSFKKEQNLYTHEAILRPWIDERYGDILEYCEFTNYKFFEDSSNSSDKYSRNYVRLNILPLFSKINPQYTSKLAFLNQELLSLKNTCEDKNENANENVNEQKNKIVSLLKTTEISSFQNTPQHEVETFFHSKLKSLKNAKLVENYTRNTITNLAHQAKLCADSSFAQNETNRANTLQPATVVKLSNKCYLELRYSWKTDKLNCAILEF